ncbi:hypothetical protein L0668_07545 [Paraglaciecola aquimarina]|uniref:CBM11 domain-containing protein n=1 Tax=Paraglaciecola algarum TaxID=3050085 RepID=A0ABS9D696_9ALTE|nr:hypothetical protein [Paraglaciecola sp. G1-23]MCF2947955.1 hypothetical protein [Paraglaciecola sp. G1-23]
MQILTRLTLISIIAFGLMVGCSSTSDTQSNKQTQKTVNNDKIKTNKQNKKSIKNLLAYVNPGFEKAIDPRVLITRQDNEQASKAEFEVMKEAAKSGKGGLAIGLQKGDMKLQYGIWRLRDQIDANKNYRFEIDVNLIQGHAVMFNQVGGSGWKRGPINNQDGWQVVSTVLEGKHLKTGKPLAFHIDRIKNKAPGMLLVDNVRLYAID